MRKNAFITFICAALVSQAGYGQILNTGKLDSLFRNLALQNVAMGSLAISKNGKILYNNTFGYSLYETDKKILATDNSKYRIGSISKIFTAAIIFQLIEEGKLTLATTLQAFFPHYRDLRLITISHLLDHRSGIRNMTSIESKETPRTHEEML